MKKVLYKKGFTLVELMVVVAIIAILTAIVTTNFAQSKSKARDAKRISDIAQLQLTLEMVFDKCHVYPASLLDANFNTTICTSSTGTPYSLSNFISVLPKDPLYSSNPANKYSYGYNDSRMDYVLMATLENNSSVLLDSVEATNWWNIDNFFDYVEIPCTHASPGPYYYCVQPR